MKSTFKHILIPLLVNLIYYINLLSIFYYFYCLKGPNLRRCYYEG